MRPTLPAPRRNTGILRALLIALPIAGCGPGAGDPEAGGEAEGPPDAVAPEVAAAVEALGAPAAAALADGLVARLGAAIDERGVAGAVDFCSAEALALTQEIQDTHDPRLGIKRSTNRFRNPANAPDESEARMLAWLEGMETLEAGSAPATAVAAGPVGSFRFYRVLRTAPLCLQCHGPTEALDPSVREILDARYPGDRARGYAAGDFRGVIRVEVPGTLVVP